MSANDSIQCFKSAEILSEFGLEKDLEAYLDILFEYNKKINLVSRETSRSAIIRVAADCLIPFKFSRPLDGCFFDIGSGGGLPAVVLLLAFKNLHGVMYERTQKKARFLDFVIKELKLDGEVRPENWPGPGHEENIYDLGTIKLVKLDRMMLKHANLALKPGGRLIYYASVMITESIDAPAMTHEEMNYYLDDLSQLRTISVFSKS